MQKEKKHFGYIYESTDKRNGILYIGKHVLSKFNPDYHGSGTIVSNIIRRHGNDTFTTRVVDWADSKEELIRKEKAYIAAYRIIYGRDSLYNITDGGEVGGGWPKGKKKKPYKAHRVDCMCASCKHRRGENTGEHKIDCNCGMCQLNRGVNIVHKDNCSCFVCEVRRGKPLFKKTEVSIVKVKKRFHRIDCNCISCKSKRGEYIHKPDCRCACCTNHKNRGVKRGPHKTGCRCVSCASHQNRVERNEISGKI